MTDAITTILLSYNRPRMLREALASMIEAQAEHVILVDDGSDFDAAELVRSVYPSAKVVQAPKMTLEQRLITPRLGTLINRALALVDTPYVAYLCDDDLFHPGWLSVVQAWFGSHPLEHWCRGDWYIFDEGQTPTLERLCPLDGRQLTTGNFAHAIACYSTEGIRWNSTSVACHDDMFLWDVARFHNVYSIPHAGAIAGWRRVHKHNALGYTQHAQYNRNAPELFSGGWLE